MEAPIGHALPRDISVGEKVERELDAFIYRRHDRRVETEGERAVEEAWRKSERRVEAKRLQEEHAGRIGVLEHLHGVYTRRAEEIPKC